MSVHLVIWMIAALAALGGGGFIWLIGASFRGGEFGSGSPWPAALAVALLAALLAAGLGYAVWWLLGLFA